MTNISSILKVGNIILQFQNCTTITWLDPNLVASGFFFPMGRIVYPVLFSRTKPIFSVRLSSFLLLLNPYFSVQSTLKGSDRLFAKYTVREHATNKDIYFCVRSRCNATIAKTLFLQIKKGSQKSEQFRTEKNTNSMNFTSGSLR